MRNELTEGAARIFDDLCDVTAIRGLEQEQWSQALWQALSESGYTMALVPEEQGGAGAAWMDVYPLVMNCGRRAVPVPLPETLAAQWLLPQPDVELPVVLALCNVADARRDGTQWRISGRLEFVPFGGYAALVVTTAEIGGRKFLLCFDATQLKQDERRNLAGEPRNDLILDDITSLHCISCPDEWPDILLLGAALRAAQIAGAIERVLEMTLNYASERVQFGKPLARFQVIQHHLAVMAEEAAAATVAAEHAFDALDRIGSTNVGLTTQAIAAAKIRTGEAAGKVAAAAHALHGAIGFSAEYELQLLTRRLWSWRSEFGTDAYWSERLGRHCLDSGEPTLWKTLVPA